MPDATVRHMPGKIQPFLSLVLRAKHARMATVMAAYYLTAVCTWVQVREGASRRGPLDTIQVWDGASEAIVFADSPADAQSLFEKELNRPAEGEDPKEVRIRKMAVAPFVGHLFTESGNAPLNWPKIRSEMDASLESASTDDFEQGYWVDVERTVRPENLSFSLGTLQSDVPEDIRLGLNWSGDKQFYFLLHVLPLPQPPIIPDELDGEAGEPNESDEPSAAEIEEMNVTLPDTAVVIYARNSVVAAWLWRRYAAKTQWNNNAIRITPLCGIIGEAV